MRKIIRELYLMLTSRQRRQMIGLFCMMLLSAAIEIIGIGLVIPYLAVVTDPDKIMSKPIVSDIMMSCNISTASQMLVAMTVLLIIVFVVKECVFYILGVGQSRFVNKCRLVTSKRAMKAFMSLDYEDYLASSSSAIITLLSYHLYRVHELLFILLSTVTHLVKVLIMAAFVFVVDWKIALVLMVGTAFVMSFMNFFVKPRVTYWGKRVSDATVKGNRIVNESFSCKKEIDIYNRKSSFYDNYVSSAEDVAEGDVKRRKYEVAGRAVTELCCVLAILLFVLFTIISGSDISSILGVLSAFALVAIRMVPSVSSIISGCQMASYYEPSVHLMSDMLANIDRMEDVEEGKFTSCKSIQDRIEFKNVSFRYKKSERNILSNCSLEIMKGQRVGIIGETGKGKTTLVNLLIGLLMPSEGEICVDGIPVNDGSKRLLLNVGYVPQDCALLDAPVFENVCFGRDVSSEEFWGVLKMAGAFQFVSDLPDKEKTVIGQNGFRLSGGQKQRLGIARALVGTPSLLVFDEATSALDNQTESGIIDTIYGLGPEYTIIMIAHRLSTLARCDAIINLDE